MTPNDFMERPHVHTPAHAGMVYDTCACGATRQRVSNFRQQLEPAPWHVCYSCVLPGFRFTINGEVKEKSNV